MARKGTSGNNSGGGGKPAPIPPNNGSRPAGWPSGTGKPSGGGRNNGPAKGK